MWPVLAFGGLVAAVFLSGCKDKKEKFSSAAPSIPSPPSANVLPEVTQDGYQLAFREDLLAIQVYQGLQRMGIKPSDLDQGCYRRKFEESKGIQFEKISEKDRRIHSCEVYGLPLVRYKDFPAIAALITQKPISWSLDDFDPSTTEDQVIRESMQQTISFMDGLLKSKGYQPDHLDYKKRMALALNYRVSVTQGFLALLQDDSASPQLTPQAREVIRGELKMVQAELKGAEIPEFWDFLKVNAYPQWKSDFSVELSALDALKARTGDCTEQTKVLYGALQMAGLTASFVEVDPWRSDHWLLKEVRGADPNYRHVALQVEFDNSIMILDPSLLAVNPPHQAFFPLTLRQFVALELSNRALGPTVKGGKGELQLLDRAIALDDTLDIPFLNRAKLLLEQEGKPEKALEDMERAIGLNPRNAIAYGGRAKIYFQQKKFDLALKDLNQAIDLNPLVYDFYQNRGAIRLIANQLEAAEADFKKALGLAPAQAFPIVVKNTAVFLANRQFSFDKMELEQLQRDLGKEPAEIAAQVYVLSWIFEAGHPEFAKQNMKSLVKEISNRRPQFSPTSRLFLGRLRQILSQKTEQKSLRALWKPLLD